jgi:hypothetical protein
MQFVCTPRGDECNSAGAEVPRKLAACNEVVLLRLRGVKLVRERISSEVVQGVAKARRTRCVDSEHIQSRRVSRREIEGVGLEDSVWWSS